VTLVLKPAGRGNWSPVTLTVAGARACPILVVPGQLLHIGGVTFRICEVKP